MNKIGVKTTACRCATDLQKPKHVHLLLFCMPLIKAGVVFTNASIGWQRAMYLRTEKKIAKRPENTRIKFRKALKSPKTDKKGAD